MRSPVWILGALVAVAPSCVDIPEVVVGNGGASSTSATSVGGSGASATGGTGGVGGTGASGGTGGTGAGGSGIVWPDTPTVYCTDGTNDSDCPSAPQTQDGQIIGPLSFGSPEGDSTRASETNFLWSSLQLLANPPDTTCDQLTEGGLTWRVPTYPEFMSLVDLNGSNDVIPLSQNYDFAALHVPGTNARAVEVSGYSITSTPPTAVVCIATPLFTPTFTNLGNGIWQQLESGLEWDITPRPTANWVDALGGCPSGWRLPTAKEVVLLAHHPLLSSLPFRLWTGSPRLKNSAFAFVPNFRELTSEMTVDPFPSICVRPIP